VTLGATWFDESYNVVTPPLSDLGSFYIETLYQGDGIQTEAIFSYDENGNLVPENGMGLLIPMPDNFSTQIQFSVISVNLPSNWKDTYGFGPQSLSPDCEHEVEFEKTTGGNS
jgi:hypothetical protein